MSHGPANRGRRVLSTAAPLYLVTPRGPVRGGVVLLHDRPGLTADVEACAQRLAADGWLTVAPLHYYDTGGRVYADPDQAPRPSADSLHADVRAALDYLVERRGLPGAGLAVVGIGQGGQLAAWAADACDVAATALDRPDPDWTQLRRFLTRPTTTNNLLERA